MLNNNCLADVMGVDFTGDDDLFNTSHVEESSLASADFYSKSLNDIHTELIPQNGLRPKLFAFNSDDLFFSVSISFEPPFNPLRLLAMTLESARVLSRKEFQANRLSFMNHHHLQS